MATQEHEPLLQPAQQEAPQPRTTQTRQQSHQDSTHEHTQSHYTMQRVGFEFAWGCVNTILAIPVMISFAAIVYQHLLYRPFLPLLTRMLTLSCAIHQLIFSLLSTMPFAIGQVQDVGLIFLSSIASSIATTSQKEHLPDTIAVSTTLVALSIATFIVGVVIVALGKADLARYAQYVPLPVIGGYLAYVGLFMAVAGVGLGTGSPLPKLHVSDPGGAARELGEWWRGLDAWVAVRAVPALGTYGMLTWVSRGRVWGRVRWPRWTLPVVVMGLPVVFWGVVWVGGWSVGELEDRGWVMSGKQGEVEGEFKFWQVWDLYQFKDMFRGGVDWKQVLRNGMTVLPLAFVVAFGSSMDIAAIQADYEKELNYSKELVTVGISNLAVSLVGVGYTGSYIISQTLFNQRQRVRTRTPGLVLAVAQFAIFCSPIPIFQLVPPFFLGGLLLWIGSDILVEWLVVLRLQNKLTNTEYVLLVFTLLCVICTNVEGGVGLGIVGAVTVFAYSYAQFNISDVKTAGGMRSSVLRPLEQWQALDALSGNVHVVAVSGYLFFGSAVQIGAKLLKVSQEIQQNGSGVHDDVASPDEYAALSDMHAAQRDAPQFLLVDFRRVTAVDATAAMTLSGVCKKLSEAGIHVILTHVNESSTIGTLLAAHNVTHHTPQAPPNFPHPPRPRCFSAPTLEDGLQHCEQQLLSIAASHNLTSPSPETLTLHQFLHFNLTTRLHPSHHPKLDLSVAAQQLRKYVYPVEIPVGRSLFATGDPPDHVYFLMSGWVRCSVDSPPPGGANVVGGERVVGQGPPPTLRGRVSGGWLGRDDQGVGGGSWGHIPIGRSPPQLGGYGGGMILSGRRSVGQSPPVGGFGNIELGVGEGGGGCWRTRRQGLVRAG